MATSTTSTTYSFIINIMCRKFKLEQDKITGFKLLQLKEAWTRDDKLTTGTYIIHDPYSVLFVGEDTIELYICIHTHLGYSFCSIKGKHQAWSFKRDLIAAATRDLVIQLAQGDPRMIDPFAWDMPSLSIAMQGELDHFAKCTTSLGTLKFSSRSRITPEPLRLKDQYLQRQDKYFQLEAENKRLLSFNHELLKHLITTTNFNSIWDNMIKDKLSQLPASDKSLTQHLADMFELKF
ncbi:Hypothetical protein MVR_LOCUS403 [uncultured virus]|nr:Hypothetical protein MVR_LOCUS403 [uncultured virus]